MSGDAGTIASDDHSPRESSVNQRCSHGREIAGLRAAASSPVVDDAIADIDAVGVGAVGGAGALCGTGISGETGVGDDDPLDEDDEGEGESEESMAGSGETGEEIGVDDENSTVRAG
jgi:hypothetical protein